MRALGSTRSHRDLAKSRRVLYEVSFISPKCLLSRRDLVAISEKLQISPSSWRDLVYLAEISFISARSRLSRRNIFHLARVSARSRQYLAQDRFYLVPISEIHITNLAEFLTRSRRDLIYLAATLGTLQISPRYWRDLGEISFVSPRSQRHRLQISPSSRRDFVNLNEISFISARSRCDLRDITNLPEISSRLTRSRRDLCHLIEISLISPRSRRDLVEISATIQISARSRRDLCDNTNLANLAEISVQFLQG